MRRDLSDTPWIDAWPTLDLSLRLVVALNDVVPSGVTLSVTRQGAIKIAVDDSGGWTEVQAVPPIESFALQVLATLQDEVIEGVTKTGWPPADPSQPDAPQSAADLPSPPAEVAGEDLICWYGSREQPALRLPPIPA